jgi:hypothetical protein
MPYPVDHSVMALPIATQVADRRKTQVARRKQTRSVAIAAKNER